MSNYILSRKADDDIVQIARLSVRHWGVQQAEQYVLSLHELFKRLADFPDLGRDASAIRPGALRMHSGSHVTFYRRIETGILIVRVLHERMDFQQHLP